MNVFSFYFLKMCLRKCISFTSPAAILNNIYIETPFIVMIIIIIIKIFHKVNLYFISVERVWRKITIIIIFFRKKKSIFFVVYNGNMIDGSLKIDRLAFLFVFLPLIYGSLNYLNVTLCLRTYTCSILYPYNVEAVRSLINNNNPHICMYENNKK